MELTPEQRRRIQDLLEAELHAALRRAADAGARPDQIAAVVAERRRALEELPTAGLVALPDDLDHPVDQPPCGEAVGEQG